MHCMMQVPQLSVLSAWQRPPVAASSCVESCPADGHGMSLLQQAGSQHKVRLPVPSHHTVCQTAKPTAICTFPNNPQPCICTAQQAIADLFKTHWVAPATATPSLLRQAATNGPHLLRPDATQRKGIHVVFPRRVQALDHKPPNKHLLPWTKFMVLVVRCTHEAAPCCRCLTAQHSRTAQHAVHRGGGGQEIGPRHTVLSCAVLCCAGTCTAPYSTAQHSTALLPPVLTALWQAPAAQHASVLYQALQAPENALEPAPSTRHTCLQQIPGHRVDTHSQDPTQESVHVDHPPATQQETLLSRQTVTATLPNTRWRCLVFAGVGDLFSSVVRPTAAFMPEVGLALPKSGAGEAWHLS
jgi:hypothetical protein